MPDVLALLLASACGYLLGAVPTASLVARARGADVFEVGSGNMGAMNTARNLGWLLGAAVLLADAGKGALAVVAGGWIAGGLLGGLVAGCFAVLGHCFSVFVGFRGGKGLATLLGVSLPLYPLAGLAGLVLLAALYLASKSMRFAVTVILVVYPLLVPLTLWVARWPRADVWLAFTATVAAALIAYLKHLLAWRGEGGRAVPDRASATH